MTTWLKPLCLLLFLYSCTSNTWPVKPGEVLENNPETDNDHAVLYANNDLDFSVSYWGSTDYWVTPSAKKQQAFLPGLYRKTLKKYPGQHCLVLYKLKSEKPPRTFSVYYQRRSSLQESRNTLCAYLQRKQVGLTLDTLPTDTLLRFPHQEIRYTLETNLLYTDILEYHLLIDSAVCRFVFTQDWAKGNSTEQSRRRQLQFLSRDAQSVMNTVKTGINARLYQDYLKSPAIMASNVFIDSKYNYLEPLHWLQVFSEGDTLPKRRNSLVSALKTFHAFVGNIEQDAHNETTANNLPVTTGKYTVANALEEITRVAATQQVVMLNEDHLNPYCRVFARQLLQPLYQQGFRYLAVEALTYDSMLHARKYALKSSGFYTSEPSFGDLLRRALQLGFHLVPYENDQPCNCSDTNCRMNCRDSMQAKNIAGIFTADPRARVLVYAGHGHIYKKTSTPNLRYMAERFATLTGITPFCIDQAALVAEPGATIYQTAGAQSTLRFSSVLRDSSGGYWVMPKRQGAIDMQIIHPANVPKEGPAEWLTNKGENEVNLSFSGKKFDQTLLQVFYQSEILQSDEMAVPLVNLALKKHNSLWLKLPDSVFYCRVINRNRVKLYEKALDFTTKSPQQ